MELVLNESQIRTNALRFDRYRTSANPSEREFFGKTLKRGNHFVCFKHGADNIFCPSRFCGYQNNNMRSHEAHKANQAVDGRHTDPQIKMLLGALQPHAQVEKLYRDLCATVGVTPKKYQRTYWLLSPRVDSDRLPLSPPLAVEPNPKLEPPPIQTTPDSPNNASDQFIQPVDPAHSPTHADDAHKDLDIEVDVISEKCEANGDYNASTEADAREFQMRAVAYRRGQRDFRERLINAYEGRCAVTECSVHQVLEAAHIKPFCEDQNTTYVVCNGILLRSDIHTLFDLYLMGINPDDDFKLTFAKDAMRGKYKKLNGKPLRQPADDKLKPSPDLLRERWLEFCSRNGDVT